MLSNLHIMLNNLFWQGILLIFLNLIAIWLLFFNTYEDFKYKSINAVLTILAIILFVILWFVYHVPWGNILVVVILFFIYNALLSVFIKIFSGDIILLPSYVILYYIVFQNITSDWIITKIAIYWLLSIVLLLPIITWWRFKMYVKKNNIDTGNIEKKELMELKEKYWIPALPVMTWLFVLYVIIYLIII